MSSVGFWVLVGWALVTFTGCVLIQAFGPSTKWGFPEEGLNSNPLSKAEAMAMWCVSPTWMVLVMFATVVLVFRALRWGTLRLAALISPTTISLPPEVERELTALNKEFNA